MSAKADRKRAVKALTKLGGAMCVVILNRERNRDHDAAMWYIGGLMTVADKLRELGADNFVTRINTDALKAFWNEELHRKWSGQPMLITPPEPGKILLVGGDSQRRAAVGRRVATLLAAVAQI